jgi:hypothetical protein
MAILFFEKPAPPPLPALPISSPCHSRCSISILQATSVSPEFMGKRRSKACAQHISVRNVLNSLKTDLPHPTYA